MGNAKEFAKFFEELGGELGTTIRNQFVRKTKAFPDKVSIKGSSLVGSNSGVTRGDDNGFGDIMIDKDCNGVIAIGGREVNYEIKRGGGKGGSVLERRNWLKRNGRAVW